MRSFSLSFLAVLIAVVFVSLPLSIRAADVNGDGFDDHLPFADRDNDGRHDIGSAEGAIPGVTDIDGDGFDDGLPFVDSDNDGRHDGFGSSQLREDENHVLIVSDLNPRAFFGFYRATMMPATGWNLLRRTIGWADGHLDPGATDVLLFTYNNDLTWPVDYQQEDGFQVYSWLVAQGFNITGHAQWEMPDLTIPYYQTFDLIIYWNGYGYDPMRAIVSGTPLISVSTMHTTPMNIGSEGTFHEDRADFCVVNNAYHPTATYPLGPLTLENSMWTDGVRVLGEGVVLIGDDCLPGDVPESDLAGRLRLLRGPNPNPVVDRMAYSVDLPEAAWVKVDVFDVSGKYIQTLVNEELQAGSHDFYWNPARENGEVAPSGVYYIRATAYGAVDSRRFLFMR